MCGRVWEPLPRFPTSAASVAWTGPGYQAGGGGRTACIAVTPPRVLEEPFRVLWGRVESVLFQGRGSSRPGTRSRASVPGSGFATSSCSLPCSRGCGRVLAFPVGTVRRVWFMGFLWVHMVGGEPPRRQGPAKLPPREQHAPTRPRCVLAAPRLGDPAARCVLPFVTSSCSLAVAFLEGHFSPFIPSSPGVPTVLSHVLARALWGLAKGGTSAASVGHRPRAAC